MRRQIKLLLCIFAFSLLSGCSFFSPVSSPVTHTYLLNDPAATSDMPVAKHPAKKILLVSEISAPSWLETGQMAYQSSSDQINYFAVNKWAAPPADLLQPIVVSSLSAAGLYRTVMSAPFSGNYDQRLDIYLSDMQQVFTANTSYYLMTVRVQLSRKNTQQIIASRRFHIVTPAMQKTPESGVTAAHQAVKIWLAELIEFINANTRK